MVQTNCINNKILIICGPTASGKTGLAVECAKILGSEVISADSMNIYKGLDIGTAKPTEKEKQGVIHHMIDVVSPNEQFTVSDYKHFAEPILKNLLTQGKIPVICGGTGFYINSLLFDLSYGNGECDPKIREKYKKLVEEKGNDYVFSILTDVDPETALKLHPNDVKRVIRALEIYENGKKKSDIVDEMNPNYNYRAYSINHDREVLYDRIDVRVDQMIKEGLVQEVEMLKNNGISLQNQCMQGIGYKEIFGFLNNEFSLEEAIKKIKINTRHYAKRQITFFKKLNGLESLSPENVTTLAKRITETL